MVLYVLAGIAAWLVWKEGGFKYNKARIGFYLLHLILFQLWMCLLFFMHDLLLSMLGGIILWCVMLTCAILFWRRSVLASVLFSFCFVWMSFMLVVNISIWWINNTQLE